MVPVKKIPLMNEIFKMNCAVRTVLKGCYRQTQILFLKFVYSAIIICAYMFMFQHTYHFAYTSFTTAMFTFLLQLDDTAKTSVLWFSIIGPLSPKNSSHGCVSLRCLWCARKAKMSDNALILRMSTAAFRSLIKNVKVFRTEQRSRQKALKVR